MCHLRCALSFMGVALLLAACGATHEEEVGVSGPDMTWEEFEAQTYQEPWEDGVFIVDGDTPVLNRKLLREFYSQLFDDGALIVNRIGASDDRWSNTAKLNITYCVSNNFGANRNAVLAALSTATGNWEGAANVNFIHLTQFDSACTASQTGVVFDVRQVSGQPYLARAFFPSTSRSQRNLLIDTSAFGSGWPLANIVTHELGHALGFRHEHTRPQAGTCFEDNNWRGLTAYDSASTMHYPQCNGTSTNLAMTALDRQGAAALYGPPGGGPPPPPTCTPQSGSASGTLAFDQIIRYNPLPVAPGSTFAVQMTGSGDPDLYVRFGAQPTFTLWHCRPYLAGANESCSLTVPSGQSQAHIMVHGFSASTYTLNAQWCQP